VIEMVHRRSWVSVMRRLDHRVGIELGRTISGRLQKWKVIRSFVFVCCASIGWINGIGCAGGSPPHAKKWGSPTDGVQAALRGDGYFWNSKSTPRFYASIRNSGNNSFWILENQIGCEVELDGHWYVWGNREIGLYIAPLPPGREHDDTPIELADTWHLLKPDEPMRLAPGKHSVRIAYLADTLSRVEPGRPPVKAVSTVVDFIIGARSR